MRTPLRPLARILYARQMGENPDRIERDNLAARNEALREKTQGRAAARLGLMAVAFGCAYLTIGLRMGHLAASVPVEPVASAPGAEIVAQRADIVDRNGRILATNMTTSALYAHPRDMVDPKETARQLAAIFPELDAATLERHFTDGRSFRVGRKVLSPEQMQQVHDIGDPGLLFGPREMRLYPNGHAGRPCAGRLPALAPKAWTFGRGDRHGRHRKGAGFAAARPGAGRHAAGAVAGPVVQATVEEVLKPAWR
jgi:cell division protein FtsI (penicillin-binding protein 3)